jgi:hypothetical protein
MSISVAIPDARVQDVAVTDRELEVTLKDGRRVSAPLSWFPRLEKASAAQRRNWEISGGGRGVHWPDIDEDLSVEGLLRGNRAPG